MEIIIPILTFILGYFAEKVMDKISEKFFQQYKIRKNRRFKDKIEKKYNINAIFTEDIYPCISEEDIWIKENGKKMFLSFPDNLKTYLKSIEGEFKSEDQFFCELTLPGYTSEEISNAIELAREEIAIKFIERQDGLYFNGDKLGIVFLDSKSRSMDVRETPQLFVAPTIFRTE